jgi:hypothetical protein
MRIALTLGMLAISFQTVCAYPPNEITVLSVHPASVTLGASTTIRGRIEGYYALEERVELRYSGNDTLRDTLLAHVPLRRGVDTNTPYSYYGFDFSWRPPAAGSFSITAAFREVGGRVYRSSVQLIVRRPTPRRALLLGPGNPANSTNTDLVGEVFSDRGPDPLSAFSVLSPARLRIRRTP